MKNILIISRQFQGGGIGLYTYECFTKLKKWHNTKIVTTYYRKKPEDIDDVLLVKESGNFILDIVRFFLFSMWKILKLDYDVIFGTTYFHGILGIPAKLIRGKKLIVTIHDLGVTELHLRSSSILNFGRYFLHKLVLTYADFIIITNKRMIRDLNDYFGINENKIIFSPLGIDTNMFNPDVALGVVRRKFGINESTPILFSAGIRPKKGLEYLVEACKILKESGRDFKVIIAGSATSIFKSYLDKLNQMIDEFQLRENFIFPGIVELENMPYYYKDCDVYVAPSYYGEGWGMPCTEAAAVGVPIVATTLFEDTGVVVNNETGLVVSPKDSKQLANAIEKLLTDKELAGKLRENVIKYVKQFTWEGHAERLANII